MRPLSLLLLLLTALGQPCFAVEQSVSPGINRHYENPDFDLWVRRFESEGREVYDLREEIVATLQLKPGMQVADIGAGTGLFSKAFALEVGPTGKVYAVDISAGFVENIKRISRQQGLNNITAIVNSDKSSGLSSNSIDLAFVCDTYHHFEYPQAMLRSLHQALKKNGRLVIIDYRKQAGVSSDWVMGHVRADRNTVIREIEAAGFKLQKEHDLLQENYFLEFVKV
ncbi:MAG: methyltransferase domain-containing protein [Gammaproteobacteria bacterium]|nr:methyltransferase domain-containing protein [Gammaproteobacteria bacterium]